MTAPRVAPPTPRYAAPSTHVVPRRVSLQQLLLLAGLLSSLVYVGYDVTCTLLHPAYSYVDQAISELSAVGSPTARLWATMGPVYGLLFVSFAIGVLRAARGNRILRATGILLFVFLASGLLWPLFPIHERGAGQTWQDVGHIILAGFTVLIISTYMGVGGFALGHTFRAFTLALLVPLIVAGVGTFAYVPLIQAGRPTPWMGLIERVFIYGYLLWVGVLSLALIRSRRSTDQVRNRA